MDVLVDNIRMVVTSNISKTNKDNFKGDFEALLRGEHVPMEWDENGEPVAWTVLHSLKDSI